MPEGHFADNSLAAVEFAAFGVQDQHGRQAGQLVLAGDVAIEAVDDDLDAGESALLYGRLVLRLVKGVTSHPDGVVVGRVANEEHQHSAIRLLRVGQGSAQVLRPAFQEGIVLQVHVDPDPDGHGHDKKADLDPTVGLPGLFGPTILF